MKLWGGRFRGKTDELVERFNASLPFDRRFYREDIEGSVAHARMLGKQGILSEKDAESIIRGLNGILSDIESGRLVIEGDSEDIHSFIEAELTKRIGEAGKRLHTGRSRNDQVALDMKLCTREELDRMKEELAELIGVLTELMERHRESYMPGFTHLQKAQPTTLAHHLGAYREMFRRDFSRLSDCRLRLNESPLGAGAFAGTSYPLDREMTASELGFDRASENSMDSVSDRDYLLEYLFDLSLIAMHLSRLSEELILWNSNEYRFLRLSDAYSTGSSIMPQKKNPDIAELIRGKCGRVYGDLFALLTVMKGLPLAYNKDMQEDKEMAFDAMDTTKACVRLFAGMLKTMRFNREVMLTSARHGFTNATDAADYLVRKGVPFRDAHGIIGRVVLYCLDRGIAIDDMKLEELRQFSPAFDGDIYQAISMQTCVAKRLTIGAPGPEAMAREIALAKSCLEKHPAMSDPSRA